MSKFDVVITSLPTKQQESMKCVNACEPVFDSAVSVSGCRDAYYGPICSYPGITGWFGKNYCIKFNNNYGGCLPCIGCMKECGAITACPFN